jgi:hypothetical protein
MTHLQIRSHLVDNLDDNQHGEDMGLEQVRERKRNREKERETETEKYAISRKITGSQIDLHLIYNLDKDWVKTWDLSMAMS